jgi:hypothetical protein
MSSSKSHARRSLAAKLNAAGLVLAAAGIMIQYASGVDFPTIPPGPIILLAAAALVVFGPRRSGAVVGLVAALFVALGGTIATIVGDGFEPQLSDPSALGGFAGTLVQIAGLVIAVAAGIVAVRRGGGSRSQPRPAAPAAHTAP